MNAEAVPAWSFGEMVRAVLSIEWNFDAHTTLVPILFIGKHTRPQYVFWPMRLPASYFTEAKEE